MIPEDRHISLEPSVKLSLRNLSVIFDSSMKSACCSKNVVVVVVVIIIVIGVRGIVIVLIVILEEHKINFKKMNSITTTTATKGSFLSKTSFTDNNN